MKSWSGLRRRLFDTGRFQHHSNLLIFEPLSNRDQLQEPLEPTVHGATIMTTHAFNEASLFYHSQSINKEAIYPLREVFGVVKASNNICYLCVLNSLFTRFGAPKIPSYLHICSLTTELGVSFQVGVKPPPESRDGREGDKISQSVWKLVLQFLYYSLYKRVAQLHTGETYIYSWMMGESKCHMMSLSHMQIT